MESKNKDNPIGNYLAYSPPSLSSAFPPPGSFFEDHPCQKPHGAPLPTCRAVRALVALFTEAEPLLAVSSPTAGIQTLLLAAVLTNVALLAEAGTVGTLPLP